MISLAGATQHRRGSLIPGLTRDLLRNNLFYVLSLCTDREKATKERTRCTLRVR